MNKLGHKLRGKANRYLRRKTRVNTIIKATADRPRLVVNRSNKYIYAQVIDMAGKVLAQANDLKLTSGTKSERAFQVGEQIAKSAQDNGVTTVVFDRNGFLFHGESSNSQTALELEDWYSRVHTRFTL